MARAVASAKSTKPAPTAPVKKPSRAKAASAPKKAAAPKAPSMPAPKAPPKVKAAKPAPEQTKALVAPKPAKAPTKASTKGLGVSKPTPATKKAPEAAPVPDLSAFESGAVNFDLPPEELKVRSRRSKAPQAADAERASETAPDPDQALFDTMDFDTPLPAPKPRSSKQTDTDHTDVTAPPEPPRAIVPPVDQTHDEINGIIARYRDNRRDMAARKAYADIRDRAAYVYITGGYPTHLRPETVTVLRSITRLTAKPSSLDGTMGVVAIDPQFIHDLELADHPMVQEVDKYLKKGWLIAPPDNVDVRRPFGRVWIFKPLGDNRAARGTVYLSGATKNDFV